VRADGLGHDLDLVVSLPDAPAQIEIVAEQVEAPIETANFIQHGSPREHSCCRHVQRRLALIALTLIELAWVYARIGPAGDIDGPTD
jgi:hypothetical protein